MHITSESEVFVGCMDGSIYHFDTKGNKTRLDKDCNMRSHCQLVKVHYSCDAKLLVVAFANGKIHIRKCTQNVTSSFLSWRESCLALQDVERTIRGMECLYLPKSDDDMISDTALNSSARFEVWLGLDSANIQVWSFPLSPEHVWMSNSLSQMQTLYYVSMSDNESALEDMGEGNCYVPTVKASEDKSMVAGVLHIHRKVGVRVCIFGTVSKQCLRKLELDFSGILYTDVWLSLEISLFN